MKLPSRFPFLQVGAFAGVAYVGAMVYVIAASAPPPPATAPAGAAIDHGGSFYVGEAVCVACHAAQGKQFVHTAHANAVVRAANGESHKVSCESCHGPGSGHLQNPMDPANRGSLIGFTKEWGTPIEKQNAMCMTCHQGGQRMFWEGSAHAMQNLACSDCHNPMAKLSESGLLKKPSINETCYSCHQQQRAEFAKRSHMPLPEGKMSCVDCHNPHGSTTKPALKADSVNELCYNCHTEKRGPFLWEHAPVRENCLTCHNAHGSNHDKLLTVARPFSCQQCHGNPGHQTTFFNVGQTVGGGAGINSRVIGRSCQHCHSQVHGSNHPAGARLQR